jgi:NFU1 iron-sulfur cluster scaffold homolog, mitochondrial
MRNFVATTKVTNKKMTNKIYITVHAESTPNPSAMKFVADVLLVKGGATAEYKSATETAGSPLAAELFAFPYVSAVFFAYNYVTVVKNDIAEWHEVQNILKNIVAKFLNDGGEPVTQLPTATVHTDSSLKDTTTVFTEHAAPQTETEHKIVEVLEEYIRPAVENDGGLITFKSFSEGKVTVQLKGSCSGCPSSTVTLKAGIEALLKKMVPGVNEVVAEAL